jgi:hypothetical protein
MTDVEDKCYRPRVPDPATHSERLVIRAALKQALAGLHSATALILSIRASDEYAQALRALDDAQLALDQALPRPSADDDSAE